MSGDPADAADPTDPAGRGRLPELDALEQRVLGTLLEKEVTVPASYPMTLHAVRTGCNQSSSREPVTDLDERTVHDVLRALKRRDLVRVVWADTGRRTMKHLQLLDERLGLDAGSRALLTVLLLRGAQPAGALRTRTERLHPFADRGEVERLLASMAAADPPLVRELPRRAREQDARWVHLLGPAADEDPAAGTGAAAAADPGADRDLVLADGAEARDARVRAAYDAVAAADAEQRAGELDGPGGLPLERWLLERVVGLAAGAPVADVGCGPGHVTAHLAALGAEASGTDVSPAMVEQARARFPGGRYEVADLRRLVRPAAADGWGAVLAWYSLVHLAPRELPEALAALVRPLRPGGWLVVAVHAGRGTRHLGELAGHPVALDVVLHEPEELAAAFAAAGLRDVEWYRRGPVAARGESTDRLHLLGRTPAPGDPLSPP